MIDTNADMRFMSNNFLETGIATLAATSTASGYYLADLTTTERSRTFKFAGRFTIDATTNKLYIDGVTYTLTNGEYTGTSLAAHIDSLLSGAFTVSYDSVLFKFGFLNASPFILNAATTTNAVWETIGYIDGIDISVGGGSNRVSDMPRIHFPNEKLTGDMGYQAAIGFIGMIGDLTQEIKIPEGSVVTFKANTINDFTTPLVNKTMIWSKRGVFAFIDDVTDSAFRYWELTIESPEGPFHSEIGYLYVGDYSNFIDRNISIGIAVGFVDTSIVSSSDDGQKYTNQKTPFRIFNGLAVGLAKPVNVNFLKRLFYLKQKASPFFVALDPTTVISETMDDYTMFCRFKDEPFSRHVLSNNFELSFELEEVL